VGVLGLGVALAVGLGQPPPTFACDICAIYTATEQRESRTGWRLGVATQYAHFDTLQEDSREVPNPRKESIESVLTQILLGYQVSPRVGLQLNLPIITRHYRRATKGGGRERGDESGLGDLSLLTRVLAHSVVTDNSVFRFSLLGGIELPTGDADRLGEELRESDDGSAAQVTAGRLVPRHSEPEPGDDDEPGEQHVRTGVHGHDLALGSGSVDFVVGGDVFWSWKRVFATGLLQYLIRTEGDFAYRYANDLVWSGGPGAYLLLAHDHTLALQALMTGETKGKDRQAGSRLDDTAVTNLFVGPRLLFTWGTALYAEATVEFPTIQHNTALQIVADHRVRGALVWRF
jgi:hypothetical protein